MYHNTTRLIKKNQLKGLSNKPTWLVCWCFLTLKFDLLKVSVLITLNVNFDGLLHTEL